MTEQEILKCHAAADRAGRSLRRQLRREADRLPDRDLQIFKLVVIEQIRHQEVAHRFGTSRSRVSQIVQEVRRRLAHAAHDDPNVENHLAQQRLQCQLEKMRFEHVLEVVTKAMGIERSTLNTTRCGDRNRDGKEETWNETTNREQPFNIQIPKTYLRITEALGKINQRDIASNPVKGQLTPVGVLEAVANIMAEWLDRTPSMTDRPSNEFLTLVREFAHTLRFIVQRWRLGFPLADAWPDKITQSAIKHDRVAERDNESPPASANQTDPTANHTYDATGQSSPDTTTSTAATSDNETANAQLAS
jgi:Sigma-70, region 4